MPRTLLSERPGVFLPPFVYPRGQLDQPGKPACALVVPRSERSVATMATPDRLPGTNFFAQSITLIEREERNF